MARRPRAPSVKKAKLPLVDEEATWNEQHYMEVDHALLFLDSSVRRIDRAIETLVKAEAEPHLIEALERARDEVRDTRRRLMQGTLFAVPKAQLSLH